MWDNWSRWNMWNEAECHEDLCKTLKIQRWQSEGFPMKYITGVHGWCIFKSSLLQLSDSESVPSRAGAAADTADTQTVRNVSKQEPAALSQSEQFLWSTLCARPQLITMCASKWLLCVYLCPSYTTRGLVKFTHIVMESLGLAGMFACLPPVRGSAVQIPEYTVHTRQESDSS